MSFKWFDGCSRLSAIDTVSWVDRCMDGCYRYGFMGREVYGLGTKGIGFGR